jgi:hypothetical protein
MLPQGYEFQSETLQKNVATTKAAAVVAVLEAREISLSDEQRARILTCVDIKLLDQWLRRAATRGTADELF